MAERTPRSAASRLGDSLESQFSVANAISVCPKPHRKWGGQRPGGAYLIENSEHDVIGQFVAQAEIAICPEGCASFVVSRDSIDRFLQSPKTARGAAIVKVNGTIKLT